MDAHVAHAVLASQLQGIIPQACEMAVRVCMLELFFYPTGGVTPRTGILPQW